MFFGRRIEQGFGNWMAHYTRFKVKDPEDVDALDYMPHEEPKVTSFEQERMKSLRKKSA